MIETWLNLFGLLLTGLGVLAAMRRASSRVRRCADCAIPQAAARASQVSNTPNHDRGPTWLGRRWGCPPPPQVSRQETSQKKSSSVWSSSAVLWFMRLPLFAC